MKKIILSALVLSGLFCANANASIATKLLEPKLTIKSAFHAGPSVALTLDACSGKVDERILQALIDNNIKATIFATARWLKHNPEAIAQINAHPDLFEVENHGAKHLAAVDEPSNVYGVAAAGSPLGVENEVRGGASAILAATGHHPVWYRGATGRYTKSSVKQIEAMGYKVAGYSLLGDGGAGFSEKKTAKSISAAKNGDVIIAHINQPTKPAGAGVVEGILKLKAAGYSFLRLEDGI
jgi:peptidoglycan/xylan/chitin deacetylase (PgdA/CDA1 family)